ncbi:MAG: IPT/TIG domain-containing protein [Candidatus Roizmanbacteria bacterium]
MSVPQVRFLTKTNPTCGTIAPVSGPIGTVVTITGTNFGATQGTSTIKFGTINGVVTSWSTTQIKVKVPTGLAPGVVTITITTTFGTCTKTFTVTVNCPPGSVPDCKGICNGPNEWDCGQKKCYNPDTEQPSYGADCAGKCFAIGTTPVNKPDCAGKCFGTDTTQGPLPRNAPDCDNVCAGPDVPGYVAKVFDCNMNCGGPSYYDCSGVCVPNNCVAGGRKRFLASNQTPSIRKYK